MISNFTRLALKNGEHTWGKDVKSFLHDTNNWTNEQLQSQLAKNASNFFDIVNSWVEQRAWGITYALESLTGHPLGTDLQAAYDSLRPSGPPDTAGFTSFSAGNLYIAGRWSLSFDAATGGIDTLIDSITGTTWASKKSDGSLLAWPHYLTLSADDYSIFTGPEPGGYYPLPGTCEFYISSPLSIYNHHLTDQHHLYISLSYPYSSPLDLPSLSLFIFPSCLTLAN